MNPEPERPARWVWTMQPVNRMDLLVRAARLNWPRCRYASVTLEGEGQWREAAMPYACDRRELLEQLDELEATK